VTPPIWAPPYGPPGRLVSLRSPPPVGAGLSWGVETPGTVVAGWAEKTYAEGHIGVTTCLLAIEGEMEAFSWL